MRKREQPKLPVRGTWPFDDDVVGLREVGADRIHALRGDQRVLRIGSSSTCDIVLPRRKGDTTARPAELIYRESRWWLRALGNEPRSLTYCVDAPVRELLLIPGIELRIEGMTLLAESMRSRTLRHLLSRVIGFSPERHVDVDRALRAVLLAARGCRPLLLCGDGDLVHIARRLHEHTFAEQPFVLCDPRRRTHHGTGKAPLNIRDPIDALVAAAGGTLCISGQRLPDGFLPMIARWRESSTRVQLMLLTSRVNPVLAAISDPVVETPLFLRWRDRFQIMDEVIAETAAKLGAPLPEISRTDRQIIIESRAATLSELEIATARLTALRCWPGRWGGIARAARALGMTHGALAEWAERRGLITVRHRNIQTSRQRTGVKRRRAGTG